MTINILLITYSVGMTILLVFLQRRRSIERDASLRLREIADLEVPASERLEAMVELTKLERERMPWFERSLSAIGVIGFFSMTIAAGVQTMKSVVEAANAEELRHEAQSLQGQLDALTPLLSDVASSVMSQYRRQGWLERNGFQILKSRLHFLESSTKRTQSDSEEMFTLSLLTSEAEVATRLANQYPDLVKRANPADLLSLTECYYLIDDRTAAREVFAALKGTKQVLSPPYMSRYFTLRGALGRIDSPLINETAASLNLPIDKAQKWLQDEVQKLDQRARDWRMRASLR